MDTRQTSFQLDADTAAMVAFLKDRGFGTRTNIIREAIKRMAEQERKPMRYFRYTGPDTLTRGDYGVGIRGGHTTPEDPDAVSVFDPDFGDFIWSSVDAAIESGEWEEVNETEHANL